MKRLVLSSLVMLILSLMPACSKTKPGNIETPNPTTASLDPQLASGESVEVPISADELPSTIDEHIDLLLYPFPPRDDRAEEQAHYFGAGRVVDGKKEGEWKIYRRNDRSGEEALFMSGTYEHDERVGEWTILDLPHHRTTLQYVKGKLDGPLERTKLTGDYPHVVVRGGYKEGEPDGRWTSYDLLTPLKEDTTLIYDHGVITSTQLTTSHRDGSIHLQGSYVQGKKSGVWKEYRQDGTLRSQLTYADGQPIDQEFVMRDAQGGEQQRGYYKNGKRSGLWTVSADGSKLRESPYVAGELDGEDKRWSYEKPHLLLSSETYSKGKLNGVKRRWHTNGQLEEEWEYRQGKPVDGEFVRRHPSGSVSAQGTYRDGEPQGVWITFYESGAKQTQDVYDNGRKSGDSIKWTEAGVITERGSYEDGLTSGTWTAWNKDGEKLAEQSYRRGRLQGLATTWRHSPHKGQEVESRGEYVDGLKQGPWIERERWSDTVASGRYELGLREGEWASTFENGQRRDSKRYEHGMILDGPYESFHENGKLHERGTYARGCKDGVWTSSHDNEENAKIEESTYKDCLQEGPYTKWYPDGKKRVEGTYQRGVASGRQKTYHSTGALSGEGMIKDGLKVGEWSFYDERGKLLKKETY